MNQTDQPKGKQIFQEIRNKRPQKLVQLKQKSAILEEWIRKFHLSEFRSLYVEKEQKRMNKQIKQSKQTQKVLDSNDSSEIDFVNQKNFNQDLLQAINIIVKAYEKNNLVKNKYEFEHVQEMVDKTKLTLKELIQMKTNPTKSTNIKEKSIKNVEKEPKKPQQSMKEKDQQNAKPINTNTPNQTTQPSPTQPLKQPAPTKPKPKSNSLFVQKQVPISEQNIFKGQNNFRRPSSRLMNQKNGQLMGDKPKSSTKSNRSKRSHASSQGGKEVDKKSENFQQSQLEGEEGEHNDAMVMPSGHKRLGENEEETEGQNQNDRSPENEQDANEQQNQPQQPEQSIERQDKKIIFNQVDQNPFHLPAFRLSSQSPIRKKNPVESILTNPFIKKAFNHLCKQNYIGGGKTFDQIAQSADIMTLNKWMVFCKEFDFISKLKKKQLVDVFQQCTLNKPHMNQKQFLEALIIVQSKMKVDEEDFIRKSICLDSEFAFREKVAAFKVNYAGPKQNFFEESTFNPLDKYYQSLKEEKYQKERQKQKEIILHQGKFRQQIQSELKERKNQRDVKKSRIMNSSLPDNRGYTNQGSIEKINQGRGVKSPYLQYVQKKSKNNADFSSVNNNNNNQQPGHYKLNLSRRIEPLTYSQLFTQKNSTSTRAFTTEKPNTETNIITNQRNTTQKNKQNSTSSNGQRDTILTSIPNPLSSKQPPKTTPSSIQQKSPPQTTRKKPEKAQEAKPQREWVQEVKNWADEFQKADSEESDDILKEHLMNQKMKERFLPERMSLSRIADEFTKDEKWLQPTDPDHNSEWERQTQLQTTSNKLPFK